MDAPFPMRSYQERMVASALEENTIVVLPTGSGKTLVAAELLLRSLGPALFLVPTRLLVAQQALAIHAWTKLRVKQYMGGLDLPARGSYDVLVAIAARVNAAVAQSRLSLNDFHVVVFDEVHHALKVWCE